MSRRETVFLHADIDGFGNAIDIQVALTAILSVGGAVNAVTSGK